MTTRKRETFEHFTERAIRATEAGKLIPPIVYLPKMLRGEAVRITLDHTMLTVNPPTIQENHLRIAEADPLGMLLAIMHGQPIPAFKITKQGSIEVEYHIPDMQMRERVAKWLGSRVTLKLAPETQTNGKTKTQDWDTMVANMGSRDEED